MSQIPKTSEIPLEHPIEANGGDGRKLVNEYLAGTVAGMAGLIVGYPFDTVKVRLQRPETARKYASTFGAFATIIKEEKFAGLFKGITAPMATLAPLNGLVFGCYGFFQRLQQSDPSQAPTMTQIMIAGTATGILSSIVTTPTELIKIRQQGTLSSTGLPSTRQVVRSIYRVHGLPGLYRGFTATILRDSGYGPYFFAYEGTCRLFSHPSASEDTTSERNIPWPAVLLAGASGGVIGWLVTFPFDVIKTRVQSVDRAAPSTSVNAAVNFNSYRSTWSTAVNSYRAEGASVFFAGLRPTLIRAIPVNMATFGAFELMLHFLR